MDFAKFVKPDTILRPAPFWAVNDRLTPEEMARQMEDMIGAGLSGAFFHSRAGLVTEYMGEEWFSSVHAAVSAARKKGGYLWLYDEDLWPSGNAGGEVTASREDFRETVLQAVFVPAGQTCLSAGEKPKAAYILENRRGFLADGVRKVSVEECVAAADRERLFFHARCTPRMEDWGGRRYLANLLNPDAVREFIRLTYDVYRDRLSADFGRAVPGIFPDEPNVPLGADHLPWWEGMPEAHAAWHGRDFWEDLPLLFLDAEGSRKARLFVHRTILRQFCESFSRPLFEWCERNRIAFTGHFNAEDSFRGQICSHGGGVMAHYRYQHIPGIDHLRRCTKPLLLTVKQVSSAARQLGRKHVLTEIFGVTRHTNTFEDFKWLGDWDLVLGATFFCPHLSLYSMHGRRKRDFPPNWNYQQTYWNHLRPLNDYFTRLAQVLTSGKAVPDACMLHSIEGATAEHRLELFPSAFTGVPVPGNLPSDITREAWAAVDEQDRSLRNLLEAALNAGYDCDLGDETIVGEKGSVDGKRFRIGEMAYPVVVLPPSRTWRPHTFRLLKEFVSAGGRLIVLGRLPSELDCDDAPEKWRELAGMEGVEVVPASVRQFQESMDRAAARMFSLRGEDGSCLTDVFLHHRRDGKHEIFFIVNADRNNPRTAVLTLADPGDAAVERWDALEGTRQALDSISVGAERRIQLRLEAAGSILVVVSRGRKTGTGRRTVKPASDARVVPLPDKWEFRRSEGNVLVMDRMSVSFDDGKTWTGEDLDFRIRRLVAGRFGMKDALSWQPWVAIRSRMFEKTGGDVVLRYRFSSDGEKPRKAMLVLEPAKDTVVCVNGTKVGLDGPWHWDRTFRTADIASLVKKGENTVDVWFRYELLADVEAAYVVGDFGVRMKGPCGAEIFEEPKTIRNGSWITQGFPFYSGTMTYRKPRNSKRFPKKLSCGSSGLPGFSSGSG